MNIEKIREEFQKAYTESAIGWEPDFRRYDESGDYMQPTTYWAWWAWQASRAAIEVELPFAFRDCDSRDAQDVRDAIEAAGLKVKA